MDLYMAIALIVLTSALSMLIGFRVGHHRSRRLQLTVQLLVLCLGILYFVFVWNRPILTLLLPHTALIVLANWHSVLGCFFAGMYLTADCVSRCRRLLIGSGTAALSCYAIVAPLVGQPPRCAETFSQAPLVKQSTPFTCSPAAAASLLRLHGIQVTEAEMARLCLTRHGTHWMGLYRGLKVKTKDSMWNVAAETYSAQAARELGERLAILSVNMNTKQSGSPLEHGFNENSGHSVVALGAHEHMGLMVFDPAPNYGIEAWNDSMLNRISDGVILTLVPRSAEITSPVITADLAMTHRARHTVAHAGFDRIH